MQLIKLYFSPALLLLVLSCAVWQVSRSLPVMSNGLTTDSCVLYAQTLLHNITDTLSEKRLFSGIDCMEQNMELNTKTDTASVCAPTEAKCSGIVKSGFQQDSCLTNIGEDLHHYYTFLAAQPDPDSFLDQNILLSLKQLMENCFPRFLPSDLVSDEAAAQRQSSFDERLNLCKVLKGFQVRAITINRAMAYINSGEHTK